MSFWTMLPTTKLFKLDSENGSGNPLRPQSHWRHLCRLQGPRISMEPGGCFPKSFLSRLSTWLAKTKLSYSPSRISSASRDIGKVAGTTVSRHMSRCLNQIKTAPPPAPPQNQSGAQRVVWVARAWSSHRHRPSRQIQPPRPGALRGCRSHGPLARRVTVRR